MSFLQAANLWWLLPAAGVVVALYLLKLRRRDMRVPAVFLWPQQQEEVRANSLFQRLRFSWLLVLQLLACALVALAVARPQVTRRGLTGNATVIVIDSSLTMGATDIAPSRLEAAKRKALEIVDAAGPGDKISVIDAGANPQVLSPLSYDPPTQKRVIGQVRQSDCPPTVGEALRIAAALVGANPAARIVLLSDGSFGSVKDFSAGQAKLSFESFGKTGENVAVTALGTTDTAESRVVYAAAKNFGARPQKTKVHVTADGAAVRADEVDLAPGQTWSATFAVPVTTATLVCQLETSDALAADNTVVASVDRGARLRVLAVGKGDPFLERALVLDPRVTLDRATSVPASERSAKTATYDVVVFDGVAEEPVVSPGVIVLGGTPADGPVSAGSVAKSPRFTSQKDTALLRAVDFSQVGVERAQSLKAGGGEILAQSSVGPLVIQVARPRRKVYLAFAPLESDFPLQPGFPIFLANCLDFVGQTNKGGPLVVRPGAPFALPSAQDAILKGPDGSTTTVTAKNGLATVHGLPRTGRYQLTVDGQNRDVYCSLAPESRHIDPSPELKVGGSEVKGTQAAKSAVDVWPWVALVAVGLLCGEWWLFARRS